MDDSPESIDTEELFAWMVAKVEKAHGVRLTAHEDVRLLRERVIEAVHADSPDVHVALTLRTAQGEITIDERLTRTAARSLFARVAGALDEERQRERERPKRNDEPTPERFVDRYGFFIYLGVFVIVVWAACAFIWMLRERHERQREEHNDPQNKTHEPHSR